MNCQDVEELVPVYLLGALDERERVQVEAHIRECPTCLALFHEQSPATTLLSRVGDSLQAPAELKQRILGSLGTHVTPRKQHGWVAGISSFLQGVWRRPLATTATFAVAIAILSLSVGTLLSWLEVRELRRDNANISATLQTQMELIERESHNLQNLMDLAYTAAIPGISTVMLEGSEAAPQSRGMLMISPKATWAMLWAVNLQQLPEDKAYQLWLTANGTRESGGLFTVNNADSGQLMVQGIGPITKYQTMGVSIEPAQGSPGPTGTNVLWGVIESTDAP